MVLKYIFLLMMFISTTLLYGDFNDFIKNMKKQEKYYTDKNTSELAKEELVDKFNFQDASTVADKHKDTLDKLKEQSNSAITKFMPWISENIAGAKYEKELQYALEAIEQSSVSGKKVDTIFYLFSMAQNERSLFNFVSDASKLEAVDKDIKYYGIVQGMLTKEDLAALYQPFEFNKELSEKTIIKMHPLIFKDLELNRVPAYLFSKCSFGEFKYKECENKYLVRGDISLHAALEIVVREDETYKKHLDMLEQRER